jgi:hypothetical protein
VLETEPRVASMAGLEVAVEEPYIVLSRASVGLRSHCFASAFLVPYVYGWVRYWTQSGRHDSIEGVLQEEVRTSNHSEFIVSLDPLVAVSVGLYIAGVV